MNNTEKQKLHQQLSPQRRALLEHLYAEKQAQRRQDNQILHQPLKTMQPLSFAQERLWFMEQLDPHNPLYNEHAALRITGMLDTQLLEGCFQTLIQRHAILRTVFTLTHEHAIQQRIIPELQLKLHMSDMSSLNSTEQHLELRRIDIEWSTQPFDLLHGPLLRVKIVKLQPEQHIAFVTLHHAISDGWSIGIMARELFTLYTARQKHTEPTLPQLPIQYHDFAYWQRHTYQQELLNPQLSYWKKQLSGSLPLTDWPADQFPIDNTDRTISQGAIELYPLPTKLTTEIHVHCTRLGCTPFMFFLSAFALLLSRHTRQNDILLGSPIAGRTRKETEHLIGCFINTLALRIDLSGDPSFEELVTRVKTMTLEAYSHQDVPFEKIVQELQPERTLHRNPLFTLLFNFNNTPQTALELAGMHIERIELSPPIAKFPLTIYINEDTTGSQLRILYQTNLYTQRNIQLLFDHYSFLLTQITASPTLPISHYSLITPESSTLLPVPQDFLPKPYYPPITHLLIEQALQHPQHIAVKQGEHEWSYTCLRERATELAHILLDQGLCSREVVAIQGKRGFGLIVAMCGVLLSGGVLLPIDATLPTQRQKLLLAESKARYVLRIQEETTLDASPFSVNQYHILTITHTTGHSIGDAPSSGRQETQDHSSLPHIQPHDPAYIFFTSGTTGTPKGVLGSHQGLSHFLDWQRRCFTVDSYDRCAQLTGLSFDVVLRDIFLPLTSGATLIIPVEPENRSAHAILPWLAKEQITLLHTTPSIAHTWMNDSRAAIDLTNSALRLLFLAGEPLTHSLIHTLSTHLPDTCEVVNLYGPTETSLAKCYQRIPLKIERHKGQRIPIGRPLPETQVFIWSSQQRLCGIGEIGEIVIRTPFRSLGYLNATADDNKRFVPNPFRDDDNDLLYRTGDYGRYLADGCIDILGRMDQQIKIRGVRIEPAEVATQLSLHPAISACVVHAQTLSEQTHLVAYVVLHPEQHITSQALRQFLSISLPAALLPSAFIMLDTLPLTINGKVDVQALPSLHEEHFTISASSEPPKTPREVMCSDIWLDLLPVSVVGRHDDFFALGGHSLLAMEVIARLEKQLQIHIPLKTIFMAPTIAELAQACEQLLQTEPEQLSVLPQLVPQIEERYEPFPLTDIQQAYWVGRSTSFEMGNIATHNYSEFTFTHIDIPRFQLALQRVIERHDMLRACIRSDGLQHIFPQVPPYQITFHNLHNASIHEVELHLTQLRQQLSHQVFPLDHWPLFELQITQVSDDRFIVHISIDALICDAWSRQILGRELWQYYLDTELHLPPLPLSFRDYVLTEMQVRTTPLYQRARTYWLERLQTLPSSPDLPLRVNPKTVTAPHFVRRSGQLSPESWQQLQARLREFGLTPSALICAAYVEILALWSKSSNLTVNLTLFNRLPLHPQVNELIGDFTSLTLLSTTSTAPTFAKRAQAIHAQLIEDMDHRAFSGIEVLRELNRRRGGETSALMPVVLTSTLGGSSTQQEDIINAWYEGDAYGISQTPQVFLDHAVSEQRGSLVFRWDAVQEIFPDGMIEDMFCAYQRLLQGLAMHDEFWHYDTRHHLLPQAHVELQMAANATQSLFSHNLLHSGFLRQAQQQPDASAIITAQRQLNYRELDLRSAWLAQQLIHRGARPNQLIAVCMDKGWEQVVAVLAILRAGAAYLPIDPDLPVARRHYLLAQGEVEIILTQPWLATTQEWPEQSEYLLVTEEQPSDVRPHLQPIQTKASDLAYVMYTSGSTGLPKGVMIDHRGALNTIEDINQRFSVGNRDRVLALSALNFDLSVYDIFGLLAAGGCIVLPTAHAERDPQQWLELLQTQQISIWNTVPALLEMLVEHMITTQHPTQLMPLRLALLSGDWISLTLPKRAWQIAPQVKLISLGGATEASIWSIYSPIEEIQPEWQSIPYGKPLRNQSWYVLNEQMDPCPIWVPGHLYIGGIGLAQGYWRDPAKTEASFLTHPVNGERLYRTGDLGRYLPDGQLEFLGREDSQVKIQGHRIELGEVEATLESHPNVQNAIVLAQGATRDTRVLVAYIVLHDNTDSTLQDNILHSYLQSRLPMYMIPVSWIHIDMLPLTANGKVDRQALSLLTKQVTREEGQGPELLAPRTAIEEKLASAYALILDLPTHTPGLNENFFSLGGNSISAIQLVAHLNALFNIPVPLRTIFEHPTIASLAQIIEQMKAERQHYPAMEHVKRGEPLPLSLAQERIWFLCQLEPNSSFYHIPAAVKLLGPLNQAALQQALLELQRRHETLRTLFPTQHGRAHQVILSESIPFPFKILDSQMLPHELQGLELDSVIAREVDQPFDLEHEPLFRVTLLKQQTDEHIFIVTMHHIISDAWSMEVFIRELIALYEAYAQNQPSPLSPLPYQFVDFAAWQRTWVTHPTVQSQLSYWRNTLAPLSIGTAPLSDYPRTTARSFSAARRTITFTEEQTRAIRALGLSEKVTPFMILLSAYSILLSLYQPEAVHEPIAINTSIANRGMMETEDMIGFFLSTLIIATNLDGNPTITELFERVRNQSLEAYNHQDIPFEHIVKEIRSGQSLTGTPFSRVAFGMRNTPLKVRTAHQLTIEPLTVQRSMAKFDLEVQLLDNNQYISGFWEYNAELFRKSTINLMVDQFMSIVSALIATPQARLDTLLVTVKKSMEEKHHMDKAVKDTSFRKKLLGVKPKKVSVSQQELFVIEQLAPTQPLPLVIKPAIADLNLVQCVQSNRDLITQELAKHGAILFRGFSVPHVEAFELLMSSISPQLLEYKERSTPRTQVSGTIYTSTEYPADQPILLHNENAYSHTWPLKIAFYSQAVASQGGETPIADSRLIYQMLPTDIRERFAAYGVMYVRNYGKHLDLSWQTAFQTSDRAQVEEYCRKAQIEFEWLGLDRLRTRQIRQGVFQHPNTGDMVWFNQAHLFHNSSLDPKIRASLLGIMEEQDFPRHAYYGDGRPLEEETLAAIRAAYQQTTISFPWQQDDVLLLDNMLVAHGRLPYTGTRKVLVAMAEPLTYHFKPTNTY